MKIDQVVVTGMMAIALSASPNADGVLTPMVITVRPASESLEARDLTVLQGNTRVPVVRLQRLTGDLADMELFVLLDDSTRSSSLGIQLPELKTFLQSLPATTQVAVGYMRNGTFVLAQAQAQLAKTAMDVDRDTPLAKERAIAQSQLDNDIQANRAAKAAVKAAEAQVEQAQLNLEFTEVKSLVDGMAGIAQVQIGNLVNPTTVLTSVSKINPIKAYFSISEQEYIHFADRINADARKEIPSNGPPFELILADGSVYPHKGTGLLANRQVDVSTGSIQIVCSFPNPQNFLRPGQFGRLRAAPEVRRGALLVPQKAVSELQGSYQVAVVGADNKVSIRAVKAGDRVGPMWIVEGGVKPGEQVVVEGLQKVQNGATVRIKQPQAKGD